MAITVYQYLVLEDNYNYLIHDSETGFTAVVDPSEYESTVEALEKNNWTLSAVLNTHHHYDHVGGNQELKERYGAKIYGPRDNRGLIPGLDVSLGQDDTVNIGSGVANILHLPGHTYSHIAYHIPAINALFCGDVLFSLGCGRVFEGSMEDMHNSLQKIAGLPKETQIYCAHEYTLDNARFALSIESGNAELQKRVHSAKELREKNLPTVPSTLEMEFKTNPFLRAHTSEIRKTLDIENGSDSDVFAKMRHAKDDFRKKRKSS